MRGGARVLPGAAVFGVRGAAAVFGVGGAAAVCAIFRRRSRSARFAAVFRAGLCAGLLCRARARIINFSLI